MTKLDEAVKIVKALPPKPANTTTPQSPPPANATNATESVDSKKLGDEAGKKIA